MVKLSRPVVQAQAISVLYKKWGKNKPFEHRQSSADKRTVHNLIEQDNPGHMREEELLAQVHRKGQQ